MICPNCKSDNSELIKSFNEVSQKYYEYYGCNDCGNSWECEEMKYFIVSEMELKQKIDKLQGTYHNTMDLVEASSLVEEILADKQPVEMVAEGEVNCNKSDYNLVGSIYVDSLVNPYHGKSIKIHVEVII